MNPIKSFIPAATWLLRIFVLVLVYQKYFDTFISFSFNGIYYYLVLAMVVMAMVLFVGGFVKKHAMTMIAGFFIFGISTFLMFWTGVGVDKVMAHLPLSVLGFCFLARGNS
ncbi:hypothetical protein LX69_02249 [Breznakibacter xylanolyticus]|uniref:DoxX-like protein n=1 Tax=Breznakibacter xylanolyticus TaxID=990 RepID=A0A2W7N507_9BACT|nr:hypothetical protein [Breznakibacter xylanolyticus]MBN2743607.1 hypothetical protein [Marinilabiliaceae bacterium]PZX15161.1 hypothetical protein LX69_02249 [Breznakibacter xylanolyticus]